MADVDLNEFARRVDAQREREDWHTHSLEHGRFRVQYERRTSKAAMGRFGGGWNWEVGFQAARGTLVVNLLIASVRVDWHARA